MGPRRTRLAVVLLSAAVLALELVLMRALSLRYWQHFAYMIISVTLLGFGASGTLVTLFRQRLAAHRRGWLSGLSLAFALSIGLSARAAAAVRLDIAMLTWEPWRQLPGVAALELLLCVPFGLAGGVLALVFLDNPARIGGHYAANLIGSGLGAAAAVVLMHWLDAATLMTAVTLTALAAALVALPVRRRAGAIGGVAVTGVIGLIAWLWPYEPGMSQFKMLPQLVATGRAEITHTRVSPLGRIDVAAGTAIHHAPGLSLNYTRPIAPHVLLLADGEPLGAVYDCPRPEDWVFADSTTAALAYQLNDGGRVLIVGAGGGGDIGLALLHQRRPITALEMNRRIIELMTGPLRTRGGSVYEAPGVKVLSREARGFLAAGGDERFDIIQVPAVDAFAASGAGLLVTAESHLYTVEAVGEMLDHLAADGVLCITRWRRWPARDGLRLLDIAAEALRRRGPEPAEHLVMIRSWATVTIAACKSGVSATRAEQVREFCDRRSFDLCWMKGLEAAEVNRHHILAQPDYYQAAAALLGPQRRRFLDEYLFDVSFTTDDRPYFYHFSRPGTISRLRAQLGARSRALLEAGYLMRLAALIQTAAIAAVLIVLPLLWRRRNVRRAPGKAATAGYFLLLGAGFMLLEMGLLHKLVLHLAHPIYAASAVITAFVLFAGAGSWLSSRWAAPPRRVAAVAGLAVVAVSLVYLLGLDSWLTAARGMSLAARLVWASLAIAPLAAAMGHLFPLGLRRVGSTTPALVPWAWAVNGFASVVATIGASALAMEVGFHAVIAIAAGCYALAAGLALRLP